MSVLKWSSAISQEIHYSGTWCIAHIVVDCTLSVLSGLAPSLKKYIIVERDVLILSRQSFFLNEWRNGIQSYFRFWFLLCPSLPPSLPLYPSLITLPFFSSLLNSLLPSGLCLSLSLHLSLILSYIISHYLILYR